MIVEEFDKPGGYSDGPRLFSLYYGAWCLVAFLVFHPALSSWAKLSLPAEDRIAPVLMIAACAVFAVGILPILPDLSPPADKNANEIITADIWYFLPKSVEVLLQQILMAALVVVLAAQKLSIIKISVLTAALFGGFHLSLALDGANPFYVMRYTIAATLFGAITPYQMMRMRNGFVYSFTLHWGWYAFDTTIWRFVLSGAQRLVVSWMVAICLLDGSMTIFSPGPLRDPFVCLIFHSSVVPMSQGHSLSNLPYLDP